MSEIKWTHEVVEGEFAIMVNDNEAYGYFEHDRLGEEGGAGGLWFEGKELTDYDGVYALPVDVAKALRKLGYTIDWSCVAGETDPEGETND